MRNVRFIVVLLSLMGALVFVLHRARQQPSGEAISNSEKTETSVSVAAKTTPEKSVPRPSFLAARPSDRKTESTSTGMQQTQKTKSQPLARKAPDVFPPDSIDPPDATSKARNAAEVLAETDGAQSPGALVFKTMDGSFALSVKDGACVLVSADGTVLRFTDSGNGQLLQTGSGTQCHFVASPSDYFVGRLTMEAYVLVTPDGQEITLTTPQATHTAFAPFDSTPASSSTIQVLDSIKETLPQGHELYTTPDKDYVLAVHNGSYRLISSAGSTPEFEASADDLSVQLPSGTSCKFVAGNDNLSVGKLTTDSFVVLTEGGEEKTLGFIAYSDQYSVSLDENGQAALVYTGLDSKPNWWLSMSERREQRRSRYLNSGS